MAGQPRTGRASLPDVRCVARAARGRRQCRKSAIPTSEPPTCRTHAKTVPHTVGPRPLEPGVPPVTERVALLDPPPPRPPAPPTVEVAPGRRVPVAAVTAWLGGRPLAWTVPVPAELAGHPTDMSAVIAPVPRDDPPRPDASVVDSDERERNRLLVIVDQLRRAVHPADRWPD